MSDTTSPARVPLERPTAITFLAILNFIGAGALGLLALLALLGAMTGDRSVLWLTVAFGLIAAIYLAGGLGLWRLRPHGRTITLVLCCVGLLAFPLGTVIAIVVLLYLLQPPVKLLFSGRSGDQLGDEERRLLAQPAGLSTAVVVVVGLGLAGSVVIGGIIAAIAVPNFLNAMDRGKQKRSMADIRTLATTIQLYAIDQEHYPIASSLDELLPLVSDYVRVAPSRDAWGNTFYVYSTPDSYVIGSCGKEATPNCTQVAMIGNGEGGPTRNFSDDIVFNDGIFVQWPEGRQR